MNAILNFFRKCEKLCFFFLVVLCGLTGNIWAQNSQLDSLRNLLQGPDLTSFEQADLMLEMGHSLSHSDYDLASEYYWKSIHLAEKENALRIMGRAYSGLGNMNYSSANFEKGMAYFLKADSIFNLGDSSIIPEDLLMNQAGMAAIWTALGDYQKAIGAYLEAIDLMDKSPVTNKWEAIGSLYGGIGTVYFELKQFDKVLEYDLKSLEAVRKYTNRHRIAGTELLVVADYIELKQYDKAMEHLQSAEPLVAEVKGNDMLFQLNFEYGRYYFRTGQPALALEYFLRSREFSEPLRSRFKDMDLLRNLGFVYRDLGDYSKSIKALNEALDILRELHLKKLESETYRILAEVYSLNKQSEKAVESFGLYNTLNDSLKLAQVQIEINEIEKRYQNQKKSDSILMLKKNYEIQELALHRKSGQSSLILSSVVFVLLIGFFFYRHLRNKHSLLKKTEELHVQRIQQLEKDQKLTATQSLLKGQEEERSRMAKDLHDGVGGLLSGVKLSLSTMKGKVLLSEENEREVSCIIDQLDQSINELRRVSHNMMPEALIKYGLKEALENYCENMDQAGGLKVRLQTYGLEDRLAQDTEIVLYRIVQELLNNVVKHAHAKQVLVQMICENNQFTLTVEDDGRGFNPEQLKHQNGVGLQNVRARAGYLTGIVDVRSLAGEGTSVTVEGVLT